LDAVDFVHLVAQIRELLHCLLSRLGVVPKALSARALIELRYPARFAVVVKAAP
jgi:hypothetical protein